MIRALEHITPRTTHSNNKEISRLITAAVVNSRFRDNLLQDPISALNAGFNGESFNLAVEEKHLLASVKVGSLEEFAARFA